jgi:VIT1/CCC1 family predicted Fe2+/Mn2+ transporter
MPRCTLAVEGHQQKIQSPAPNPETEVNLTGPVQSPYVGDLVLGALDGSVTTFAVVAAATGAAQPASVVLIIGIANLFASGVSMALGNYLGTKSEEEFREKHRRREEYETERFPELEKEEVRKIFADKGFQGEDLERAVEIITSNKQIWVETMMRDELRISPEKRSPWLSGLVMLIAFVLAGSVPLLPYLISLFEPSFRPLALSSSVVMTFAAIFGVGTARSLVTGRRWWIAGIEMTVIGAIASLIAYVIGRVLGILLSL